jgi:hypothetical protein
MQGTNARFAKAIAAIKTQSALCCILEEAIR